MKKFFVSFLLILSLCFFGGCSLSMGESQHADQNVNMTPRLIASIEGKSSTEIIESVKPAVVGISANFGGVEGVGSGVCVAEGGYILTNHHVAAGANNIVVYFADRTSAPATLVWADMATDLAIIKTNVNLPYLNTANAETVKSGDDVIAIGTPLTLQFKHTSTKGIVSALDRTVEVENEDGSYSYLQNLIQHDASINPGNSGGPLINSMGEVVGINSLKVSEAEGLGFAISVEIAMPVMEKIIKNGTYETPYLGLFGFDSSIAQFYGETLENDGVYIMNIDSSSPAYKSGLRKGNTITQFNGVQISNMLDLRRELFKCDSGEKVQIVALSNSEENIYELTLSKRS